MEELNFHEFAGFAYPVWVVVNTTAEEQHGESLATHFLIGLNGDKLLMMFTKEEFANEYIQDKKFQDVKPAKIHDNKDLLIRLELFKGRGGNYVSIDDPKGPTDGHIQFD